MAVKTRRKKSGSRRRNRVVSRRRRTARVIVSTPRRRRRRASSRIRGIARRRSRIRGTIAALRRTRRTRRFSVARVRRSVRRFTARKSSRRRRSSGGLLGGLSFGGGLRGVLNKNNLSVAAGGVASFFFTNWVVAKFGPNKLVNGQAVAKGANEFVLPGLRPDAQGKVNPWIKVFYSAAIPILGAMVIRKKAPRVAQGMLYSGLVNGALAGISQYQQAQSTPAVSGTSEYFSTRSLANRSPRALPAPRAVNSVNGMAGTYSGRSAYKESAWGGN